MKTSIIVILAFSILAGFQNQAQEQTLKGQIIDQDTQEGISGATVTISTKIGTISDSIGYFSIPVRKYPVEITISHLSYGVQSFTINFQSEIKLVFRLSMARTNIPEILVSGKKLQILTKGADYSVSEFEFDNKYMWLIGMVNNRPNKARLFLANLIGDTLHSVPIELPASLIKDIFGDVHLETVDSIFQLFGSKDSIQILHGEKSDVFFQIMGSFQATLGPGLVYHQSNTYQRESRVYYIDSTMSRPEPILVIEDLPDDQSWLPDGLKQLGRYFGPRTVQQILDQQKGYFRGIRDESIFKLKDSLYVIDLNNDKLHVIGPDCRVIRSVPISFHHQPNPTITNLFLNYNDLITDPLNHKVYVTYHKNNNWRFVPLNTQLGETEAELPIPKYNAMNNIRIHGGALYFTYPEKLFPYFQRVYRMLIPIEG